MVLLAVVVALSAGCAATGSSQLSELVTDKQSLVVVSLSRTYRFQNATGSMPPYVTIDALGERNDTKGRIVTGRGLWLSPRDGETWRIAQVFRIDADYMADLNLITVPAGRYALREWVVSENKVEWMGAFGRSFVSSAEVRGALDTSFEIPPNAIVYLGTVHLDEGVTVTKADCRARDMEILNTAFPEARAKHIHFEPLGTADCPK
jgi:hypothetical protein